MRYANKYVVLFFTAAILLVFIGTQTETKQTPKKAYQESVLPVIETSTTNTTIVEETTTVPETTTTTEVIIETTTTHTHAPRTTTTEPYVVTTIQERIPSGSSGPPRNTTSLVGCIAFYESTWGDADPNVFQFVQRTWEAYGGTGSPSNAPYWRQEEVFWLAWQDAGHHHWLAQKGRCF